MKCWCPMSYATSSDSTVPRHLLSCVGVFGFPYSAGMPKMNSGSALRLALVAAYL